MKEILATLKKTKKNNLILLDTCFIIDIFSKNKEKELLALAQKKLVAITSFNLEELEYVLKKKVKEHHIKDHIRHFFKAKPPILVLEVPVHPGNPEEERKYVESVDPYLVEDVIDVSDAVLVAAAIKSHSIILTKDKHHLFTEILENYIHRWGLAIYKELKDVV